MYHWNRNSVRLYRTSFSTAFGVTCARARDLGGQPSGRLTPYFFDVAGPHPESDLRWGSRSGHLQPEFGGSGSSSRRLSSPGCSNSLGLGNRAGSLHPGLNLPRLGPQPELGNSGFPFLFGKLGEKDWGYGIGPPVRVGCWSQC